MTDAQTAHDIRAQQMAYMQQRVLQGSAMNAGAGLVLALLLMDDMPMAQLSWWLAAIIGTNLIRVGVSRLRASTGQHKRVDRLLLLYIISAGLNGLAWGFCGALLPVDAGQQVQSQVVIVLLAILAAGSFNQAAYLPASIAFALGLFAPMLLAMDIRWGSSGLEYYLLLALYTASILLFTNRHHRQLLSALVLAEDNSRLVGQLRGEVQSRQQLEETARQAEVQLRTLIDTAPDGILVVDERGQIALANAEAHRLFGYEASTLVGQSIETLVPERASGHHAALRAGYLKKPIRRTIEAAIPLSGRRKDGTEFPVEIGLSSTTTPQGVLTYAAIRDLSMHQHVKQLEHEMQERRRAEDELQKLTAQQSVILNGTHDHIAYLDPEGNLIWWNQAVESDLGLSREQLRRINAHDLVLPAERARLDGSFAHAAAAGSDDVEVHLLTALGPRLYEISGVALKDDVGQLSGFVIIGRDIEQKRESERLVEEAQRAAQFAYWGWSTNGEDFSCSTEAYRLYGLAPRAGTFDREKMLQATHPEDREHLTLALTELKSPGDQIDLDYRILWPDDSTHWLHMDARTATDSKGEVFEIRGTIQDITSRKLMEQSLRASEQRLELAIAGSNDGIWDWDIQTNQVYFSPRWKEMLGYRDDELENRFDNWEQRVHPDDIDLARQKIQDYMEGRSKRFEIEFRMRHRDGHFIHILSRGQLTRDEDGQPTRLSGTHVDISERKRAELLEQGHRRVYQLMSGGGKLDDMLQALVDLVVNVEPDTRCSILLLDEQGTHLQHGASRRLPDFYREAVEGIEVGKDKGPCGTAAHSGETVIAEDLHRDPDWASCRQLADKMGVRACWSQPIIDSSGKVLGTLANYHDSPCKPKEEQLSLMADAAYLASIAIERSRMQSATKELQIQLQQAQKMEAIGHLAGGIAHDFNNILATIMGFTDLSANSVASGKTEKLPTYLEQVSTAAGRARDLVKQLLTFSRIKKGTPSCISLAELVNEVGTLLRPTLPSSIELNLDIDDLKAVADPVQMHQVLMNLSLNARDAMQGKGKLSLRLFEERIAPSVCDSCHDSTSGDFIVITVTDDGPGIPPAMLDRMFEPFASTKEVGKGSGMGLAITHGIIHELGGHILVDSRPGHTEFKLLLPKPEEETGCCATSAPDEIEPEIPDTAGRHILLVDDEAGITNMLSELLGMHGYRVTTFNNSRKALEHFREHPNDIDLVITDQTMPELSGRDMSTAMLETRENLPIILCTGFSDSIDEDGALGLGIRAFMMKPVNNTELVREIRRQLAEPDESGQQAAPNCCEG